MSGFLQRFGRDISAISWLAMSLLVGLCLISYSPADPSFHSTGTALKVGNYCGYFGSFLSDVLYQFFGAPSWSFFVAGLGVSFQSFRQPEQGLSLARMVALGFLFLILTALVGLYLPDVKMFDNEIFVGGLVGNTIALSLSLVFNAVGASVVLWAFAIILILFITEKPLSFFFHYPLYLLAQIGEKVRGIELPRLQVSFPRIPWPQRAAASPVEVEIEAERSTTPSRFEFSTERASEPGVRNLEVKNQAAMRSLEIQQEHRSVKLPEVTQPSALTKLKSKINSKVIKRTARKVENWELPKVSMLKDAPKSRVKIDSKEFKIKARLLVEKLEQFNVKGEIVGIKPGPAVTLFEFKPSIEVRLSKITELENDLSLALSSESVRIIAPIPGRDVVGIETANSARETVFLKDVLDDEKFWNEDLKLPIVLGRKANGEPKVVDLRTMPHMMVAGSTGSGKSVFTVAAITGLIFRHSPKTMRLILIDPKQVDLAFFDQIPHLLMPPILEPKKAVAGLKWAVREMEKRYRSMKNFGARKLEEYNQIVENLSAQEVEQHRETNEAYEEDGTMRFQQYYYQPLPCIVIVIEEFGDLMAVEKNNLEQQVVLLAQKARAAGIHLYLAMQSPRKDVVTGLIKTNIPGRVSFKVTNKMDSRIILDDSGAERLLAVGDMLYLSPGVSKPERHHGPYISNQEINEVAQFWAAQGEPEYDQTAIRAIDGPLPGESDPFSDEPDEEEFDEKYDLILSEVSQMKEVSASLLQRKFKIGYPRAARLVEIMEREGVVGPANGSKPRQVLVNSLK